MHSVSRSSSPSLDGLPPLLTPPKLRRTSRHPNRPYPTTHPSNYDILATEQEHSWQWEQEAYNTALDIHFNCPIVSIEQLITARNEALPSVTTAAQILQRPHYLNNNNLAQLVSEFVMPIGTSLNSIRPLPLSHSVNASLSDSYDAYRSQGHWPQQAYNRAFTDYGGELSPEQQLGETQEIQAARNQAQQSLQTYGRMPFPLSHIVTQYMAG